MPGIAGYICPKENRRGPEIVRLLKKKLMFDECYEFREILSAPDSAAYVIDPGINNILCGVYNSEASGKAVAYYGEFYGEDFLNISDGDGVAERLFELYEQHGEDVVHKLDGSFILYVSDLKNNKVLIINDHYASRPLFYTILRDDIYFAPEPKALACLPGVSGKINEEAVISFMVNGNLLNDQTFLTDVKPLLPGSMIRIQNCRFNIDNYRQYVLYGGSEDKGESYYVDTLSGLLMSAVKKRMHSVGKMVIPISGGFDSRGILGCVNELTQEKIKTVSWGTDQDTEGADAAIGKKIAGYLGTEHYFLRRDKSSFIRDFEEMFYRTDGLTDDPCFHHNELTIMRRIRNELGGEYLMRGDECFGYGGEAANDTEGLARIGICALSNYSELERIFKPSRLAELRDASNRGIDNIIKRCTLTDFNNRKDSFYFYQRLFHYLNRSSYYKMTVLELQNPWLDRDILSFFKTVPARYRIDKYLYKKTLQTMFPDLYDIPFATADSLEDWMSEIRGSSNMQDYINSNIVEKKIDLYDFLDPEQLRSFLSSSFAGEGRTNLKTACMKNVKLTLQRFPKLYRFLKTKTIKHVRSGEIPPETVIFRLLILSRVFDLYA